MKDSNTDEIIKALNASNKAFEALWYSFKTKLLKRAGVSANAMDCMKISFFVGAQCAVSLLDEYVSSVNEEKAQTGINNLLAELKLFLDQPNDFKFN